MSAPEEPVERVIWRMYNRRIDPYGKFPDDTWNEIDVRKLGETNVRNIIKKLIDEGKRVTGGYYTTKVRGYHNKLILWKEYK